MDDYLLETIRRCYEEGLLRGSSGNISIYDNTSNIITITPTAIPYYKLKLNDFVHIDLDGTVVKGSHNPSTEWRMHAAVYRAYRNVKAQIHIHSPYAMSFAINHMRIPVITDEMLSAFGGSINVASYEKPGTEALAAEAVNALNGRNACLLANHGALVVGINLEMAYTNAVCLENIAKVYSIALKNGGTVSVLNDDEEIE